MLTSCAHVSGITCQGCAPVSWSGSGLIGWSGSGPLVATTGTDPGERVAEINLQIAQEQATSQRHKSNTEESMAREQRAHEAELARDPGRAAERLDAAAREHEIRLATLRHETLRAFVSHGADLALMALLAGLAVGAGVAFVVTWAILR